jgi:hypothetical protein
MIQCGRDSIHRMAISAFEAPCSSQHILPVPLVSEFVLLEDEIIQILKSDNRSLYLSLTSYCRSQYDVIFGQYLDFVANEKAYMHFYQSCYRYKVLVLVYPFFSSLY